MFHWICPECGSEIPPAMKECPACDPSAVAVETAPAPSEPVAAAPKPVEPAASEPPVESAPKLEEAAPVAAAPAPVETPPVNTPPVETAPVNTPLVETPPVDTPPVETPAVEAAPVSAAPQIEPPPVESTPVAAAPVEPPLIETVPPAAPAAELPKPVEAAPVEHPVAAAKTVEPIATPPPAPAPVLLPVVEQEPDPMLALAELIRAAQNGELEPVSAPVGTQSLPQLAAAVGLSQAPAAPAPVAEPVAAVAARVEAPKPVEAPAPVEAVAETKAEAVALLAPPEPAPAPVVEALAPVVPEPVPAPEPQQAAPAPETKPVETGAPVVKDLVEPAPPAGDKPPSGSWLQLAPLQDYASAATRAMKPATPPVQILTPDAGPKITLPGPALPPKLERLQEANIVTVIGEEPARAKRRGMPGWLISLMLMLGIPIAGAGLLFYFQPITRSADAKAPAAQEATQSTATEPASHSVSGFVEVTGFRIVVDYNKKSEIHYLVVNHSAAELSDMTIFVTLRTANSKPGQPPLSRFSFRAPSLGPFESKEMISPIEKMAKSVQLPDWQDLRAEVQVGQ